MGTASQLKARLQCIVAGTQRPASLSGMGLMVAMVFAGLASTASGMVTPPATADRQVRIPVQNKAAIAPIQVAIAQPVKQHMTAKTAEQAPAPPVPPVVSPRALSVPAQPFALAPPEQADPRLVNVNCMNSPSSAVFIHRERTSIGIQQGVAIIMCDGGSDLAGSVTAASMMGALEAARADLITETRLTDDQRAHLIAALDVQIVQMKSAMDASGEPIPAI
jgi:hypothetical protein